MVRCKAAPLNRNFHFPWYSMVFKLACTLCITRDLSTNAGRIGFGPKRHVPFTRLAPPNDRIQRRANANTRLQNLSRLGW
ncbi:hypothetical protein PTRG_05407 [Pyrenophora tritici-repentis Pt-1C-BFP]|uniref:Uncharacterized protein n=1 Tax=Pyrenophora tritici-repentis (strain Pt-1C-BFP) TaxID=426418 RepID=B2W6G9_PYRTR|nr:uncharacterized protein PTRG_05407 [Pyrenophora tritici-repentis Pt-1C-BFP]EDU48327.1 hypothetical protein PTRG_05407 [Pyrenophora tritici-repentis Pt-1C-BFP]